MAGADSYPMKWIPIEERLPKIKEYGSSDYILISFKNYGVPDIGRYEEDEKGGAFFPGDEDLSYSSYGLVVNAWAPLPRSYRTKEET